KDRPEELFSPYYGMCLYEYRSNVINNTISGAYEGLDIWGETDKDRKSGMNIISGNTFTKNDYGLYVSFSITDPYTNQITRNNFIGNYNHASFDYYVGTSARVFIRMLLTNNAPSQSWNGNYWDDHQSNNPRVIHGIYNIDLSKMLGINPVIGLYIQIPKEEVDLNPSCAPL
ncbi:MAG: DUF1565 domain-containing protein, partial [Thermoplasmatales archaeon]|nr:DUF1565 domain-containing protein [Thermoplasmatales archaeon]